jgi:uncharacterized protein (TIGR03435 family)
VQARQITGVPAWLELERFDVSAVSDVEGEPSDEQWRAMVRKVLADRFRLVIHRDWKELSVYRLTVGKRSPTLTPGVGDPDGPPSVGFQRVGSLVARSANMADFINTLQFIVLDRPVVDQTGIAGRYDFTLNWTPDEFQFSGLGVNPPASRNKGANAPPDLFTAIQQQLELKLESTKAQVEVIVIDHVEKPSEN